MILFNLYAAFCKLSSVLDIITWSSANNSLNSCWFFESGIYFMSSVLHLVIISFESLLNSRGERGQPW